MRLSCVSTLAAQGIVFTSRQTSLSQSAHRGTLRGLHFQTAPSAETKIVHCVAGAVFDVALDLRPNSPTFRRSFSSELSASNGDGMLLAPGCAHGLLTLTDGAAVLYEIDRDYDPANATGVRWNDPAFAITWPFPPGDDIGSRRKLAGFPCVTVKRVLLTGASGFLGRQTIGPLLDLSCEVHAVGSTVTDPRARWYRADLLDQTARRQLLTAVRPDALLHCAWVAQPVVYLTSPANLDWVAASLDLARLARERGATRMLMVGSCAEYDWNGLPARPWREDDHCQPTSLYGTAKHALRNLMTAFAAQIDIGLVWARLFHLYGPHEASARLVPSLLAALREGRRAETGPAEAVRDFMHVADAGRALVHLLAGETRGVVNVASGEPVKVGTHRANRRANCWPAGSAGHSNKALRRPSEHHARQHGKAAIHRVHPIHHAGPRRPRLVAGHRDSEACIGPTTQGDQEGPSRAQRELRHRRASVSCRPA